MKRFIILIIAGLLLAVQCSDDSPTSPEPTEKPLAEATIGIEGGTVGTDDIIITIPEDAFLSNQTIRIYKADDSDFGLNAFSSYYRIDGIPEFFVKSINVMLKYTGTVSDSSYIGFGCPGLTPDLDSGIIAFEYLYANDSAGYLISEIPAPYGEVLGKRTDDGGDLLSRFVVALSQIKIVYAKNNFFRIAYTVDKEDFIDEVVSYLEEAHDTVDNWGFGKVGIRPNQSGFYRINVAIDNNRSDFAYSYFDGQDYSKGYICISKTNLTAPNLAKMRIMIGREYFDLIKYNYFSLTSYRSDSWLKASIQYWFEACFANQSDYVPESISGKEMAPLYGSHSSDPDIFRLRDSSMASFIDYIFDQYGLNTLHSILKGFYPDGVHLPQVLLDSIPDPENTWWHDYVYKYITGQVYDIQASTFAENTELSGTFDIATANDTLKTFSDYYKDFSARLYRIEPNYTGLNTNTLIQFKLNTSINEDYVDCYLLKYINNDLDFIWRGDSIIDIKSAYYRDAGAEYIALVVNSSNESPYNDSSLIDLEVKVIQPIEMNFPRFGMVFSVMGSFENDYAGGSTWDAELDYSDCCDGYGNFSGFTYTSTWDTTFTGGWSKGYFTAVLSGDLSTIVSITGYDSTYQPGTYDNVYVTNIAGHDIPFNYEYDGDLYYEITGSETYNSLTAVEYRAYWPPYFTSLTDYWCDSGSRIRIVFYND